MKKFDLIVIGSGAGLGKVANPVASLGKKVAIIEKDKLGGTCLNRGCIPSKMLIHPADVITTIEEEAVHRLKLDDNILQKYKPSEQQFMETVKYVAKVIDSECAAIQPEKKNPNITVFRGHATFIDNMIIEVSIKSGEDIHKEVITADKIVIAVGSRPQTEAAIPCMTCDKKFPKPEFPFWTSTEALRPNFQPKTLAIIGAGYIATELSHFYASFGTKVTLFARTKMLRLVDSEIAEEFRNVFSKRPNICLLENCLPTSIEYSQEKKKFVVKFPKNIDLPCICCQGKEVETPKISQKLSMMEKEKFSESEIKQEKDHILAEFDNLLVATGVTPNTDDLGLEKTGVKVNPKTGFIEVDEFLRTTNQSIIAFGDCIGKYLLRHSANYEGEYIVENYFCNEIPKAIDYTAIPYAIFSNPQIAAVGQTEDELKLKGNSEFVTGKVRFKKCAMGMAMRFDSGKEEDDIGIVKLLIEKKTRKILGCHIVGPEASVLIHEVLPIMRKNGKLDDILDVVHIHPALSELVRNAARNAKEELMKSEEEVPVSIRFK